MTAQYKIFPVHVAPGAGSAAEVPLQNLRLPRYTSYPPATEFTAFDHDTHVFWLSQLPADEAASLYIHIPYCRQLCLFCGCFTRITHHYAPISEYLEFLIREIRQTGHFIGRKLKVGHVHFGGGSPTILEPDDFTRLMDTLYETFDIQPCAEIAIEIDPRTLSREKCAAYLYNGVNRASLGVQDFSEQVQKAVNREQSYELVADAVKQLREAGIDRINLDLIYGLPYQTIESVCETAKLALTLEPQRLAVFGYAHVPWMRKHQKVLDDMPMASPEERLRMFDAMRDIFLDNGYTAIGIDHFARKNDNLSKALKTHALHRNFQGYTTDASDILLGFGQSAISSLPGGYVQNASDSRDYKNAINKNQSPAIRGLFITPQDKMRREIISELMCYYRVNPRKLAAKYRLADSFVKEAETLAGLRNNGLLRLDGDTVEITEKGRPYVRAVCAVFDQYQEHTERRFSLAV